MLTIVDSASIYKLEENLIKTVYYEDSIINAKHLEKLREAYTEIIGSEDISQLRLLIVFEAGIEISRDIGERYLINRIRPKIGEALVATQPKTVEYLNAARVLMNTPHSMEVFSDEDKALEWLKELS